MSATREGESYQHCIQDSGRGECLAGVRNRFASGRLSSLSREGL